MITVMDPVYFESNVEPEALIRAFEAFKNKLEDESRTYVLERITGSMWRITSFTTTGNHFRAADVAWFVAKHIKPNTQAVLSLRSLNGERWGWLITEGKVYELRWLPAIVMKDGLLWLKDFKGEVECGF